MRNITFAILLTLCLLSLFSGQSFALEINVIYPRLMPPDTENRISKVNHNFIFGNVSDPKANLNINGTDVFVHPNGAFIAFLPVDWDKKSYTLIAKNDFTTTSKILKFNSRRESTPPTAPKVNFPVDITLSGGALRNHPKGAYYIFADSGTRVKAIGWLDGFWEIPIAPGRTVWAETSRGNSSSASVSRDVSVIDKLVITEFENDVRIEILIGRQILYRMSDDVEPNRLILDLFGAISKIDIIRNLGNIYPVANVQWDQIDNATVRITVSLLEDSWGWQTYWQDGKLVLSITKPPLLKQLEGLNIVIDAGHGGTQNGSIGAYGLKEKDINLAVSLELAQKLVKLGAQVVMTRIDDSDVSLQKRVQVANQSNASLFLSIHHNALPDGTNPFGDFGVGMRYYHSQSRPLAQALQDELVKELGLPDEGVTYHNLAMTRITVMPAVLLEIAYMMLPEQEALMLEEGYSERVSNAIIAGINNYLSQTSKFKRH